LELVEVAVALLNREALAKAARVRGQAPVGSLVGGVADQEVAVGEPVRRERVVLRGRGIKTEVAFGLHWQHKTPGYPAPAPPPALNANPLIYTHQTIQA
jgi:hypothetical protein